MSSVVWDPAFRAAIEQVASGLDAVAAAGVAPHDALDAITLIREVEVQGRRFDALRVDLLAEIDREKWHRADGHASAKVMVRHVGHLSEVEAKRRASAARALRDLPEVNARFEAGRIGFCQVQRIARAYANKRVRRALLRKDRTLARLAEQESYRDFDVKLTEWVRRVDEDGTADRNERNHENRDFKIMLEFDGSWSIEGGCASLQGVQLNDIFRHFVKAEFEADWAEARAAHGDATTIDHLARTEGQRRMDAFSVIFERAAAAMVAAGGSTVVTNVVMDLATFERTARLFADADPGPVDDHLDGDEANDLDHESLFGNDLFGVDDEPFEGSDHSTPAASADDASSGSGPVAAHPAPTTPGGTGYRCSTIDGYPVDAREAVAAALLGHVRRVVVGAAGVVVDLGRLRRLYTGHAQLAARLSSMYCYWPGCHVRVTDCQTDHLEPWARHGGSTDPGNGAPACGKHNRFKERGFSVSRDRGGHLHVLRPDGTEID